MKKILVYLFVATVWITQAYSQIHWEKDPNNPVLKRGADGTWDDVAVGSPAIIYNGTIYHMWYNGNDGSNTNIGYATSTDKVNWDKRPTPVLEHGENGSWDDLFILHPTVYFDGTTYHMWYTGNNGSFGQIGYATSPDSINWEKYSGNPVLTPGDPGSWDDQSVNSPEVLYIDSVFHMWYGGFDGSHEQIGHATSYNGITWEKDTLNPVLKAGDVGSWDNASVSQPSVLFDGTNFHMWYGGGPDLGWRIGYAYSEDARNWYEDGRNWHKDDTNNPVLGPGLPGDWDSKYVGYQTVCFNSDSTGFDMWYTAAESAGYVGDIGFATSKYKQNVDSTASDFIVNFDQGGTYDLGSSISVDGNGNFIVVWSITMSNRNIFARRYSETGTPLGSSFKVNGDSLYSSAGPQIVANETGNFVITWGNESNLNDGDVYAQLYSNTGEKIGNNFLVNDIQEGRQWDPCVAMNNKGNFVISWYSWIEGINVFAQRFSSDGTPLSGNFKVNDVEGTGYHDGPSVTIDENDNFVVTWADERNGNYDIYAQRYSSDGNPIGENFIVNTVTDYQQDNPEVSSDKDGNFVITWFSNLSDRYLSQHSTGIFAQRYSSNGVEQGSNFEVVSSDSSNEIGNPFISQDSDGDFLIRWYDAQVNSPRAFAQVYRSNGEKIGEKFEITSSIAWSELRQATVFKDGKIYSTWIDTDRYYNNTGYFVWENVLNLDEVITGIETNEEQKLSSFQLYQNYPNPFNPTTTITYSLPKSSFVTLKIYDLLGREVRTLVNEEKHSGTYNVTWNAQNYPSGVYFYKIATDEYAKTNKMILLK